jgi:membrane-associated phospholipid phosphatase
MRASIPRSCVVLFFVVCAFTARVSAQSAPNDAAATEQATEQAAPQPSPVASPTPRPEKRFLQNILSDQRAIWTAPFHYQRGDAKWIAPFGLSTAALLATDRSSAAELGEGTHSTRLKLSKDISQLGAVYTAGGIAAAFYLVGRTSHNERARETGLLAGEALVDVTLVSEVAKLVSQRPRPLFDNGKGVFFDRGTSFPSGHSADAWAIATVVANEYKDRKLIKWGAYGLAAAVSMSRYTGRNHFLSDVLVGSALGYGIGRFVYHVHHDRSLDRGGDLTTAPRKRSKLIPFFAPIYSRGDRVYGAALNWSL